MKTTETGILFVNLGSPDSPDEKDVKDYLNEFLMDPYVIDIPYPIRRMIVSLFILPFRPKRSAEAYRSIWWDEGSPLVVLSYRFLEKMMDTIPIPMEMAMRYGSPSIYEGLERLIESSDIKRIVVIPMYPHYAMSTVKTVYEKAREEIRRHFSHVEMIEFPPFYNNPFYIDSLVHLIQPFLNKSFDHILFSYHGLPERHLKKTDPTGSHCLRVQNCCETPSNAHKTCYRHQVYETTRLVAEKLNLDSSQFTVAFQSRLGKDSWLKPFADKTIIELAEKGIKKLLVVSPAFTVDCLETLEELGIRGMELFLNHGGEEFQLVPCLNDDDYWIHNFSIMIQHFLVDHQLVNPNFLNNINKK